MEDTKHSTIESQSEKTNLAKKAALAGMVGTATEWYDYFVFATASALVFGPLFFPNASSTVGILASFATFAVTFAVRPLGALIFGHFGDRLGRKRMLVASILIMGVGTFAIGLLPTYQAIGIWAPILLILLRLFQGFAVGGEYGGATTMAIEYAPPAKKGFYTALSAAGLSLGLLSGNLMVYLFALLPREQFLSWGWRVPFLLSSVLVAVGLYIRLELVESPAFRMVKEKVHQAPPPLVELLRRYKKIMLLVIFIPTALNISFYIAAAWSVSYMTNQLGISEAAALSAVMIAALLDFFAQLFFGYLSDKIGRRAVYIGGSAWIGLMAFPFFWLLNSGSMVGIIIGMIIMIPIGHGSTYSTQASFFSELFGTGTRYSGLSLGYHIGAAITSGPGPFIAAALLALTGNTVAISLIIVAGAIVSVVLTYLTGETYKRDITQDPFGENP